MLRGHERRIKSGEIGLGDLATSESDCSSARKKGDLYVFMPRSLEFRGRMLMIILCRGFFGHGDMQKEFEQAAFALKPGEVSGLVDTASGVHLIERYVDLQEGAG